jgi:hypothetical protein
MSKPTSRDFVMMLALPDSGPAFESAVTEIAYSDQREAVAVGAQIAEFSPSVTPELRAAVADSLLLAQLAANKAAGDQGDVIAWYRKYVEVLQGVGWLVHDMEFQSQELSQIDGDMHTAIIPVITAMLGPAAAAASVVIAVLKGLQEMDRDNPWITVFDRASQHASGAKFQLGFVDADAQGNPEIKLMALAIDAQRSVTQVLFFKFSDQSTTLRRAESTLKSQRARLDSIKDAVSQRVQPFLTDYISKIEI